MPDTVPRRRRFQTRWSVIAFVVIALVVSIVVMLWQLDDGPPDDPDVGLGPVQVIVR